MVTRSWLRFRSPALADVAVPLFEARGTGDGPTLTLLAGVHGCEYASMAAVRAFMRAIEGAPLNGRIRALPIVDLGAFRTRSPFVSPADGKNLNRCFPGDRAGTVTDQLAHEVFTGLIVGSDAVVDLHAGDLVEALTPFTLYEESAVDVAARGLAEAYGLPLAIRQPVGEREVGGSTSSAAADSGIPAIIAEAGGGGRLDPGSVALHVAGLRGIAGHLGLLPRSSPAPAGIGPRHFSRFVWVRCGVDGWWEPSLGVGREVAAGQELGHVLDLFGDDRERIVSPVTGVIVFQTTSPAVGEQGLVCALAAGEEP